MKTPGITAFKSTAAFDGDSLYSNRTGNGVIIDGKYASIFNSKRSSISQDNISIRVTYITSSYFYVLICLIADGLRSCLRAIELNNTTRQIINSIHLRIRVDSIND